MPAPNNRQRAALHLIRTTNQYSTVETEMTYGDAVLVCIIDGREEYPVQVLLVSPEGEIS